MVHPEHVARVELLHRTGALPRLKTLASKAREDYGDAYAGGQIGASMAKVLND